MFASEPHQKFKKTHGFSLVEMLVALAFIAVLMTGMATVFASSTSGLMAGMETMAVQRNARWGLSLLQDEVLAAGLVFPVRSAPGGLLAGSTFQPPLLMQATDYTPPGAAGPVDELQMVMDVPLNVQGTANSAIAAGATSFTATFPTGVGTIKAGDLVFIQDAGAEFPTVSTDVATGTNVTIALKSTEAAALDPTTGTPISSLSPSTGFKNPHLAGMPFTIIRPSQVVRFTVVPRALDPGNSSARVPCLVRQARTLVPGEIWAPDKDAIETDEQILLENVVGFAVDWSLDGGKTWIRTAGAGNTWASISAFMDPLLKNNLSPFIKQSGGVYNPAIPMWTLYTPVLIRIDLTTRSAIQRTEFSATNSASNPQAAYRTRQERLLLAPRNCGIGLN